MDIQWYPGHMTKTRRQIESDMKQVDAVAEITDARLPESGRSPVVDEVVGAKPRVILLNKADYADPAVTEEWQKYYESRGYISMSCDCRSGRNVARFEPLLRERLSELLERRKSRGVFGKLRVMVLGIPNVGKSSFINRLCGKSKTLVGNRPGVTRGKQWVSVGRDIELLDTAGILWHKFEDKNAAMMLAFTGAIKDTVLDTEELAAYLLYKMNSEYPAYIAEFLNGSVTDGSVTDEPIAEISEESDFMTADVHLAEGYKLLKRFAKKRGMLISGGTAGSPKFDTVRAAAAVLTDYRGGKYGRITLEKPR